MSTNTRIQRILILSANPIGTSNLRLNEEMREIKEGLKRSKQRDHYWLETAQAVRYRDIHRAILDYEPNIIHFSGHGAGEEGLVFEDEMGQTKVVNTEALAGLFELFADQVECVVLNACYSKLQAEAIAQHINYVIGMSQAIGDRAAIEFAIGFYDALGAGRPVEFAYKLGCLSIRIAGISENLTPKLLTNNHSGTQLLTRSSQSDLEINPSITPEKPADNLRTGQGIDYTLLRDLLANSKWQEADQETMAIMLKIFTREKEGWLRSQDIEKFPCSHLQVIDQLWVKYSNGRFGFSVQKRIWQDIGATPSQKLLGEQVGWYLKDQKKWLFGSDLNFTLNAPPGHLPRLGTWWAALFSRLETCKL
jgi:GUN4-like/CHAT domain